MASYSLPVLSPLLYHMQGRGTRAREDGTKVRSIMFTHEWGWASGVPVVAQFTISGNSRGKCDDGNMTISAAISVPAYLWIGIVGARAAGG